MSLDWSVAKVSNYELLCFVVAEEDRPMYGVKKGEKLLNPVTNALIWGCIATGMGTITEANCKEWYQRFELCERVNGRSLRRHNEDGTVTDKVLSFDDVKAHIGLTTNVFPKESNTAFLAKLMRLVEPYKG
jgi:hypothetical protein